MLLRRDEIIRYYIVNKTELDHLNFVRCRSRVLHPRPSHWKVFLSGLLRLDEDLAFIRLPDSLAKKFLGYKVAVARIGEDVIRVNGWQARIEPWTFMTMCKFCCEGLQYGTFWRLWKWKW